MKKINFQKNKQGISRCFFLFLILENEIIYKVEEAVVETVEEKYVPHIEPPIQPLSWAEVCIFVHAGSRWFLFSFAPCNSLNVSHSSRLSVLLVQCSQLLL